MKWLKSLWEARRPATPEDFRRAPSRHDCKLSQEELSYFQSRLREIEDAQTGRPTLGDLKIAPTVSVWCYWRIDRDGTPAVSICDDPMGHPHVHLVRIPIPEDVQKCIATTKDPPLCMVLSKSSKMLGPCPQPSNETETK